MRQKVTVLEHLTTLALKVLANTAGKISDLASTTASAMLELKNEVTTAAKTAEADKVTFADGETFQAKYDAGELTGPPGQTGPTPTVKAVAAGTIGTPGTPTVTASQSGNTVTLTFDHLKGATGAPGSNANVTGGASSIVTANLTAGRALVSDANGKVAVSAVTSTELGYLDGVTSNVQDQLNATTRRGCIVGQSSSTAGENTWYKFASMSISNSYQDSGIIFLVRPAINLDSNPSGILQVHVRALEDKTVETAKTVFRWLMVDDRITLTDFCMVYSATSPVTVELWVRCDKWAVYSFEVLSESSIRTTRENGWTLYNAVEQSGQAAPTEGYTRINSTISTPMFGDLTMSGDARKIKYNSGKRTGSVISLYAGDENGSGIVIGDGGRTIIGGGEAAYNLRNALGGSDFDEQLHMASDGAVNVHTNCQTIANRHTFTFQADGRFSGVANPTAATDVANKQYVDNALAAKQADIFYRSVSLTVAGWDATAKTQTVTVSGVVAAETSQLIIPTPALSSRAAYQAAGIQATAQGANTVTFTAETVPTVALTVYVTVVPL